MELAMLGMLPLAPPDRPGASSPPGPLRSGQCGGDAGGGALHHPAVLRAVNEQYSKQQAALEQQQRKKNLTKYIPKVAAAL
jgi:hypothetical protein